MLFMWRISEREEKQEVHDPGPVVNAHGERAKRRCRIRQG